MLCNGFTCRKIMVQSVYILNILTGQYLFHNALDHNDSSALPGHFTRAILNWHSFNLSLHSGDFVCFSDGLPANITNTCTAT